MCARQIAKEDLPSKGLVFLIAPTISMDPQWIQPLSLIGHFCFSNTVLLAFSIGEMKPSLEQKWKNFYYLLQYVQSLFFINLYRGTTWKDSERSGINLDPWKQKESNPILVLFCYLLASFSGIFMNFYI